MYKRATFFFSALLQACGQRCCRLPSVALVVFPSTNHAPLKYYFHSLPWVALLSRTSPVIHVLPFRTLINDTENIMWTVIRH